MKTFKQLKEHLGRQNAARAAAPEDSPLGTALQDVPKDAQLIQIGAFYQNDHEDGFGIMLTDDDGFPQPLSLFGGTTKDAFDRVVHLCRQKHAGLNAEEEREFAMLVLTLELRGEIEPSEFNGCSFAFKSGKTLRLVSGSAPDPEVLGGKLVPIGHGPSTTIFEHIPAEGDS